MKAAAYLAGALACGLAMFAGSRVEVNRESAALTVPEVGASPLQVKSPQAAESALLPAYFRTIPLSTFGGNVSGLQVGVTLAVQTESGKELVGTVVAIGKTELTMRVDSWKQAAPASR